jgi:hypothetical protein
MKSRIGIVLCLISLTACSRFGPKAAGDNLPEASYRVDNFVVKGDGISETVRGASVTPAFFETAKTQPLLGRLFLADEYQSRGHQVVVVGNRFWRQQLKKDPVWLGKTLNLNERAFTIVGVLPSTFEFPSGVELWVPMAAPAN